PNIAVPTLTIVAPSAMAISKSWLIPIDSSRSMAGGVPSASSESRRSRRRRQEHQPDDAGGGEGGGGLEDVAGDRHRGAKFRRLARHVDLDQQFGVATVLARRVVD